MKITFVNVGYGEAIVIEIKDDFVMIIDGGTNDQSEFNLNNTGRITLDRWLIKNNIKKIDIVICTHIHDDHVSGLLDIIKNYYVKEYWQGFSIDIMNKIKFLPNSDIIDNSSEKFVKAWNNYVLITKNISENTVVRQISSGNKFEVKGLRINVLWPILDIENKIFNDFEKIINTEKADERIKIERGMDKSWNNRSIVLLLEYEGIRILLPGDCNKDSYKKLSKFNLKSDLFKIGHHGQIDSINEDIFNKIKPKYVVCCSSSDRRYNSGTESVIKLMENNGSEVYITDNEKYIGDLSFQISKGNIYKI